MDKGEKEQFIARNETIGIKFIKEKRNRKGPGFDKLPLRDSIEKFWREDSRKKRHNPKRHK